MNGLAEGEGHYTLEDVVGPDAERNWKTKAKAMARLFVTELKSQGRMPVRAPERVTRDGYQCEVFGKVRAIFGWIPDWAPVSNAGKFVIRLDTIVKE
jgi:hypothetical protein